MEKSALYLYNYNYNCLVHTISPIEAPQNEKLRVLYFTPIWKNLKAAAKGKTVNSNYEPIFISFHIIF